MILSEEDKELIWQTARDVWKAQGYMASPDKGSVILGAQTLLVILKIQKELGKVKP